MKKFFMVIVFTFAVAAVFFAQSRGLTVTSSDGTVLTSFSGSHALVIGESAYNKGWPPLAGVKEDIQAVKRLLEEQGFSVSLLENKTSRELKAGIEDFLNTYGFEKDVRLIIYYAGHGQTLKLGDDRELGYIVPIDAPLDSRDKQGFQRTAISMKQFDTWATDIESRHVLFLFDSCFSGSIFAVSRAAPGIIDYKISQPVRQFIASGAANETVPDKSIFRMQLEAALRNREADLNNDGYVSGSELGDFLQTTVVNYSNNTQHPQYGKIRHASLDKGDFVFSVGLTPRQEVTISAPFMHELEVGSISIASGALRINTTLPGHLSVLINNTNQDIGELPGNATLPIPKISAGNIELSMVYADGFTEKQAVRVERDQTVEVNFKYRPAPLPAPDEQPAAANPVQAGNKSYFSTGRKIGAGFLNLALGLGSFTMGDFGGGILLLGGYAASSAMILTEIYLMEDGVLGTVGLGVAGVTAIFGFIQPYLYNNKLVKRNSPAIQLMSGINAGIVPDRRGKPALSLSYTHSF
ncbi:MAG: caspase family protein [Treponema sp.]|jgi:hypothetical protein|nr:caspase family protein [Treponema sp.]